LRHLLEDLRLELPPLLRLAIPVVLAEFGWMLMGIVDTIVVGRLSPAAIGAVSLGGIVYYTAAMSGAGLLLGLDTLVSQSFGAGDVGDCHHSLVSSLYLTVPLSLLLMGGLWTVSPFLGSFGVDPVVLREAIPYLDALVWSTFPLLLYFAFRRYLQGMNLVAPIMFALVSANLINFAADCVFVFGLFGAPAFGARGAGWATCVSRVYMAGVLIFYTWLRDRNERVRLLHAPRRPDFARMRDLLRLGLPASLQMVFEIGVFATATTLIGRLGAIPLAAHQIALNAAGLSFMAPFGIGSAAAVRVGQALGAGNPKAAARSGWTATLLGAAFMSCAGIVFVSAPGFIVRLHSTDPAVLAAGVALLGVAAVFQLFDGIQAVTTGALRGTGDTRTPMLCHLIGYWALGLPAGYWLCFGFGYGATGLWMGLCLALISIGCALLFVWSRALKA
jgi:MATE family multidrug resistance protein